MFFIFYFYMINGQQMNLIYNHNLGLYSQFPWSRGDGMSDIIIIFVSVQT